MGPQLVAKSVLLIWNNLGAALRATAVPIALTTGIVLLLFGSDVNYAYTVEDGAPAAPFEADLALRALLAALISGVGYLWAAVAWHRYVLLEEEPGLVPTPPAGRVAAYLWGLVRLIGPLLLVGMGAAVAFGMLGAILAETGSIALFGLLTTGIFFLATYALLRFSLHLPAAAVGRHMGVGESWRATAPARGAILTAAVLMAVLQSVFGAATMALGAAGAAGLALSLVTQWASTLIGISVLTALYGHIVEGRPLA